MYFIIDNWIFCFNYSRSVPGSGRLPGLSPVSTPSPKKRQLPSIPVDQQRANRDRGTTTVLYYTVVGKCFTINVLYYTVVENALQ